MLILIACAVLQPQYDVTLDSLCRDASLETVSEYPDPPYETRQSSSYDRASVSSGTEAWFANNDWGNFLRVESHQGRKEHVMADVTGPGAMVRYWSPNPAGVTRIYVDGSDVPLLEADSRALLSGKFKPFTAPVSQFTSNGWSLYCPVTFQKSMKITVDDSDKDAAGKMYYQVQCRRYADNVSVEPFSITALAQANLERKVGSVHALPMVKDSDWNSENIAPGDTMYVSFAGPSEVSQLIVSLPPQPDNAKWDDPAAWHNVLRSVNVRATFDGELCVDTPLGDLMSTSIGVNKLSSMPAQVEEDGLMVMRFPMPFKTSAKFEFRNEGRANVGLKALFVKSPYTWTDRSMHFKAQWTCYNGSTRPMRDLEFLSTSGPGVFVGCNVAISNPVAGWWGEGDEKVFLDGEKFPSTFGTGTEDYFGYGWCDPTLFSHPYHYQSRCDGPGNKGQSCIGRWQILDRLPFQTSFKFDMELWHWVDCTMMYGRTAFWYAKAGTDGPRSDNGAKFPIPFIEGAPKVKGAFEAETAQVIAKSGGTTEVQAFDNLSNGKQLWWRDGKVGDTLQLAVPLGTPGRYHVFGRFCFAQDYGVQRIRFGNLDTQIDFFGKLGWKTIDLGVTDLFKNGSAEAFTVEVVGANAKAEPRHMFGFDYFMLVRE